MPKYESELRSRDIEQLLAEPLITEEPPPTELLSEYPRLLTQGDVTRLTDLQLLSALTTYRVAGRNLLESPSYEDESDWSRAIASEHTLTVSEGTTRFVEQLRLASSMELELVTSSGVGESVVAQPQPASAPVSAEAWVYVDSINGATLELRVQVQDSDGNAVETSAAVVQSAATTEWVRLELVDFTPASTQVRVSWESPLDYGETITAYSVQHRPVGVGSWTEVSGLTESYSDLTGLTAGTEYEFQVRATNADGDSPWSASTVFEV